MGVKPDSSPFEKLAKVYAINASKEDNESTPRIICSINGEVSIIHYATWDLE